MQRKDAFQDKNMRRVDGRRLFEPGMLFETVYWYLGNFAALWLANHRGCTRGLLTHS